MSAAITVTERFVFTSAKLGLTVWRPKTPSHHRHDELEKICETLSSIAKDKIETRFNRI